MPPAAFPANRQCIIVEDFDSRTTGSSSQKEDYKDLSKEIVGEDARNLGKKTKVILKLFTLQSVNSRSSVCFGMDNSGLGRKTKSVTDSDYGNPSERDFAIAAEAYKKGGVSRKPDIPSYDPINIDSSNHGDYLTVAKCDFTDPNPHKETDDGYDFKAYLRNHKFSLGNDSDSSFRMNTTTHSHFIKPDSTLTEKQAAAGSFGPKTNVASRAQCDNWETTLTNTISRLLNSNLIIRYPYDSSTYQTVSSQAYKPLANVERAQPFRPRGDLVGEYLHPMFQTSTDPIQGTRNTPIRELTTVSRRSYLPPEVMKFH